MHIKLTAASREVGRAIPKNLTQKHTATQRRSQEQDIEAAELIKGSRRALLYDFLSSQITISAIREIYERLSNGEIKFNNIRKFVRILDEPQVFTVKEVRIARNYAAKISEDCASLIQALQKADLVEFGRIRGCLIEEIVARLPLRDGVLFDLASRADSTTASIQRNLNQLLDARNRIWENNNYIAKYWANKYYASEFSNDIRQQADIGLINAIERFIPEIHGTVAAIAKRWVVKEILLLFKHAGHIIVQPDKVSRNLSKLQKAINTIRTELGQEATVDQLAERTGFKPDHVRKLLVDQQVTKTPARTELETLDLADKALDSLALMLGLEEETHIAKAMQHIDGRSRSVLVMYFGFGGKEPSNLEEIGVILGIGAARVCQIKNQALRDLKSILVSFDPDLGNETELRASRPLRLKKRSAAESVPMSY